MRSSRSVAAVRVSAAGWLLTVVGLFVLLGMGAAPVAGAQSTPGPGETINSYDVDMQVDTHGVMAVTERIEYAFPVGEQRHGIQRFIPMKARYDSRYDRRFPIDGESVAAEPVPGSGRGDPAAAARLKVSTDTTGHRVIRIGDPNLTVSGTWRYTIRYRVHDVVEPVTVQGVPMDEVVWNAIGSQWQVPIRSVTMHFTAPAAPLSARCFAGYYGSAQPCDQTTTSGTTILGGVESLSPGDAATLAVDLPPGTVPGAKIDKVERWTFSRAFEVTPLKAGFAGVLAVLSGGGLTMLRSDGRPETGGWP